MSKTKFIIEPGKQELSMERVFDAPRERVFDAFTDPKAVAEWWGPRRMTATVEKFEAKQGGVWRVIHRDPSGHAFAFHGVFHASQRPSRIVRTFEFEGAPGQVLLESMTFEEVDGKTKVIGKSVFQSLEARDGMVNAGMEGGANESFERLDELLRKK